MKKIAIFIIAMTFSIMTYAQSESLKATFTETIGILQNYAFSSDTAVTRAFYNNNFGSKYLKYSTKSIKLRIDDGCFIFLFNDNCDHLGKPQCYNCGIYMLTAPYDRVRFELSSCYGLSCIRVLCSSGMTLSHRGKAKGFTEYKFFGDTSSLKTLYNLLKSLQDQLIEEGFRGPLPKTIGPSTELKTAYNNVVKTMKEYRFSSEDTWYNGETKSITFTIQDGILVFTFNDGGIYYDPQHSFGRDGKKIVKVPISHVYFYQVYNEGKLVVSSSIDDVEITWRGRKEIEESYKIMGPKASIIKLQNELETLVVIATEEGFQGTLGVNSTSPKKTKTQASPEPQKEDVHVQQPEQRQRKRIPTGN